MTDYDSCFAEEYGIRFKSKDLEVTLVGVRI